LSDLGEAINPAIFKIRSDYGGIQTGVLEQDGSMITVLGQFGIVTIRLSIGRCGFAADASYTTELKFQGLIQHRM